MTDLTDRCNRNHPPGACCNACEHTADSNRQRLSQALDAGLRVLGEHVSHGTLAVALPQECAEFDLVVGLRNLGAGPLSTTRRSAAIASIAPRPMPASGAR